MSFDEFPPQRGDLLVEGLKLLDGSGAWDSGFVDTEEVFSIRVVVFFLNGGSGAVQVQEAQWDGDVAGASSSPRVIRTQSITISSSKGFAQLDLSARYFKLVVSGGTADDHVNVTVRRVA